MSVFGKIIDILFTSTASGTYKGIASWCKVHKKEIGELIQAEREAQERENSGESKET